MAHSSKVLNSSKSKSRNCPFAPSKSHVKNQLNTGKNYRDMGSQTDGWTDKETLFCNIVFCALRFCAVVGFVVFVCFTRFHQTLSPQHVLTFSTRDYHLTTYKEPSPNCHDPVVVSNTGDVSAL